MLKHVLETKHDEEDFKCAVIVNDMAELNIDKSLIDNTSLIQSDEAMVGMQNGCICCTLQNDLVEQIISLTQKKKFNYILIEASGISEPHEIAPLFELQEDHDHDHDDEDHDHDHDKPQLGEVARLDTCVTLIDSADFYNNLGSMKAYDQCDVVGTIAELMMDQVEFANVILLNKGDLVNKKQKDDLIKKVSIMNPNAKIVNTIQSKINVKDILDTKLYKDKEEFWVTSTKQDEATEAEKKEKTGRKVPEACTARFDINSFVYRARKPFHPTRLNDLFMDPNFMIPSYASCKEDKTEEEKKKLEKEDEIKLEKLQKEANGKQKERTNLMGELLRSKGFIWVATSHDLMGGWQQAGNVLRILPENPWMCLEPEKWEGTGVEDLVRKDMQQENGDEYEYQDRRQEIVFIGHRMKRDVIQALLDKCLLTDEEMALGPEGWKETMADPDAIKFFMEDGDIEDEEEDDENEEDNQEENDENLEEDQNGKEPEQGEDEPRGAKRKREAERGSTRYDLRKRIK